MLIEHCLNVCLEVYLKLHPLWAEHKEVAIEKVSWLLEAGFIHPMCYPLWLASVVMIYKVDGKWRMYVDFTNLNKVCPRDSYPLPSVDALVYKILGCELLNFMDAHS